jgi:Holliday junction DNA helicase RuvA
MALYGATDERGIKMFETLLGVSGIGPKVALSILGTMPVDSLENAISGGNVDLLTRIPGIGRKTASRLVLELKGKLDIMSAIGITTTPTAAGEVVEALTGLGYSPAEIQAALSDMPKGVEYSTEEMVLHALKRLGR